MDKAINQKIETLNKLRFIVYGNSTPLKPEQLKTINLNYEIWLLKFNWSIKDLETYIKSLNNERINTTLKRLIKPLLKSHKLTKLLKLFKTKGLSLLVKLKETLLTEIKFNFLIWLLPIIYKKQNALMFLLILPFGLYAIYLKYFTNILLI